MPQDRLAPADRDRLARALADYVTAQRVNADRPEHRLNLAQLYLQQQRLADAEAEFMAARALDPAFPPVYVGLAQLYGQQHRDAEGERTLRDALARLPDDPQLHHAQLHHALGLNLVRQRRVADALPELARAAAGDPATPRYAYVYAIALNSSGRSDDAIKALEASHARHPADRDTLFALVTINRDAGHPDAALAWAQQLAAIDPSARPLVDQLRQRVAPR